ncbi:hypothetical protein SNEBB_003360 [Seison nebaliae]|nr:hypothetical protein SNEBB_003360 [Seison nebaliae]
MNKSQVLSSPNNTSSTLTSSTRTTTQKTVTSPTTPKIIERICICDELPPIHQMLCTHQDNNPIFIENSLLLNNRERMSSKRSGRTVEGRLTNERMFTPRTKFLGHHVFDDMVVPSPRQHFKQISHFIENMTNHISSPHVSNDYKFALYNYRKRSGDISPISELSLSDIRSSPIRTFRPKLSKCRRSSSESTKTPIANRKASRRNRFSPIKFARTSIDKSFDSFMCVEFDTKPIDNMLFNNISPIREIR